MYNVPGRTGCNLLPETVAELAGKEALSHQRTYSPVEKRELQTRPEISITKVLDGRFQKKYESYLRDQFPGRDHWVSFQTDMELFMGKNEIHNVYIGKNHYLFSISFKISLEVL